MVPSIADRAPYFWKVISLFSNEDNWHESFSCEQKLYAKEHTINFQKKQDPEKKNKQEKKPAQHQHAAHTHTKQDSQKNPKPTTGRLYCLIHMGSRGKKKSEKDQTSWRLGPSRQTPRNLLNFCLQTSEPWKFSTAMKGRALKNYKTLIRH